MININDIHVMTTLDKLTDELNGMSIVMYDNGDTATSGRLRQIADKIKHISQDILDDYDIEISQDDEEEEEEK